MDQKGNIICHNMYHITWKSCKFLIKNTNHPEAYTSLNNTLVILNCLSIGTFIALRCPTGMDCELHRSKWWKPACALCVQEEEKEEEVGRYKKHSIATNPVWRRNWVLRFDQHPNNRGAIYINMGSLKSSYPSKNANFTKSRYTNKSLNVLGIQTPSISLLMDWQISVESTRKFHVSHPLAFDWQHIETWKIKWRKCGLSTIDIPLVIDYWPSRPIVQDVSHLVLSNLLVKTIRFLQKDSKRTI